MKLLVYIVLCGTLYVNAQKRIEKSIALNQDVSSVVFDLEEVFSINLKSTKTPLITLNAISEGEYANHFLITDTTQDETLIVSGKIGFTFPNKQDKLSAHKVHAITIEITVPEWLQVTLNSAIGNLNIEGYYNELTANSKSGNCELLDVSGQLAVQTINGDIHIKTKKGHVIAESKKRGITQKWLGKGTSVFKLKTVKGQINIEQSQ